MNIAIFGAVSKTIEQALLDVYKKNNSKIKISRTAFEIALNQLV